ncbi:MAG: hypothetical protein ACLFVR_16645 [Thiohalospira sp.]
MNDNSGQDLNKYKEIKGKKIYNCHYFNYFSLIIQDTSLSENLFRSSQLYPLNLGGLSLYDLRYIANENLTPVILDELRVFEVEEFVKNQTTFWQYFRLRKYIRLYIGCIDLKEDTCVIVQYVKPLKYLFNSSMYNSGFYHCNKTVSCNRYYGVFRINKDTLNFLYSYIPIIGRIEPVYSRSYVKMIVNQKHNKYKVMQELKRNGPVKQALKQALDKYDIQIPLNDTLPAESY